VNQKLPDWANIAETVSGIAVLVNVLSVLGRAPTALVGLMSLVISPMASAHHGFPAHFDPSRIIRIGLPPSSIPPKLRESEVIVSWR
jgi:hypothetical protein